MDSYFHDRALHVAVARALGVPVTTGDDGTLLVQEPIRASQMASLRRLDLTGLGIADLRGLEFATNLETLSLAGNRVSELSPLAPATVAAGDAIGSPVGLKRLEHLSLDFNPVTDLSPLAELVNLKSLSVDGEPNLGSPQVNGILQVLNSRTPGALSQFGQVVAASADYVVVSAPLEDAGPQDAGAVYVYRTRDGSRLRTIAHPQPQALSHFGSSLALDGDLLVVGAPAQDVAAIQDAGAAYVFDLRSGALLSTLTKPGGLAGDNFGASVALSGSRVVVGAPGDDTGAINTGAAFVLAARTGSLIQRLPNPTPTASEAFGSSLAVEGDTLVVGAPLL